ncbi:MAG: hypothetical protein ACXWKR_05490, partial [Phenylobacterium sp.]
GTLTSAASASVTVLDPSGRPQGLGSIATLTDGRTTIALTRGGESISVVVRAEGTAAGGTYQASLELAGPPDAVHAVSQRLKLIGTDPRSLRVTPLKVQDGSRILSAAGTDAVALNGRIAWDRQMASSSAVMEITVNYN